MGIEELKQEILGRVKDSFLISGNEHDEYIKTLTSNAFEEFLIITGANEVDRRFLFVIEGVVSKRYVRRGSEGLKSENIEGYRVDYKDSEDDFKEYHSLLKTTYNLQVGEGRRGKIEVLR